MRTVLWGGYSSAFFGSVWQIDLHGETINSAAFVAGGAFLDPALNNVYTPLGITVITRVAVAVVPLVPPSP